MRAWLSWLTGDLDAAEQDLDEIRRLAPDLTEGQLDYAEVQLIAAMALEADQWETAVETVAHAAAAAGRGWAPGRALGDDDGGVARVVGV